MKDLTQGSVTRHLLHMLAFFGYEHGGADARVIAFGSDYLRIVAFNFVAAGIVFTSSNMFQGSATPCRRC